jgi:hypothetical protein
MGSVMDAALARADGPFETYEESLIAFARANYALRLDGGRCVMADLAECGGRYYDPDGTYPTPALEAVLEYAGERMDYEGAISSSFGMDFIEVHVDRGLPEQPFHIALRSDGATLNVEVWGLGQGTWAKPRALTPQPEPMIEGEDGLHMLSFPRLDPATANRVALIITRLDADERPGSSGDYTITLDSGTGGAAVYR